MSLKLTPSGADLLLRALAGTAEVHFTHVKLGSGTDAGSSAADLTTPKMSFPIHSITIAEDFALLTIAYNNNDVPVGFRCTEFGVFAIDPDDSSASILYAYEYTDPATADYVPSNTDRTLETEIRVLVYVGDAADVTAEIASGVYALREDLEGHGVDPDAHANIYIRAGKKENTTLGAKATAEGGNTTASGDYSHAEGLRTTASGPNSHAEGGYTNASGQYSHAEGDNTKATGHYSHAEGNSTTAGGACSHAEGNGTNTTHRSQHVAGEYNQLDPSALLPGHRGTYVEIIGNGTADDARSNARTLDWSGNEVLAGKLTLGAGPTANMDAATKKYVDDAIAAAIAALGS